jgi:hypothetical protein
MQQKQLALREFWRSRSVEGGVEKQETCIRGFDELLEGGLPKGRATLVSAGPDTNSDFSMISESQQRHGFLADSPCCG